jgi:3-oxoacyl-[acyl-carrier protein] reductase
MELKGGVAVVTGSSSGTGIGAECAKGLAAKGCKIVINYLTDEAGAEATAAECTANGVEVLIVQGDVSQDSDCRRMVRETMDRWGRLDVLVNNAATTKPIPQHDLEAVTADEFHRLYAVNVVGNFQMTRAAAPHLRASGDGAVVNISSIGAFLGNGSSIPYAVSKGALNTLTIALARQLAPEVRVNAICPGGLLGNWTRKIMTEEGYQNRVAEAETKFPLQKAVWPEDVARLAVWLAGDAKTITGEAFRMDSGQHLL